MKTSARACPDCGSPTRGNPCWWYLDNPQLHGSGADRPCDDYFWAQDARARERRFGCRWFWAFVVAALTLIAAMAAAYAQEHHHPTEIITGATAKFYETWMRPDEPEMQEFAP